MTAQSTYRATYQREKSPPIRDRLEQHSIEEVVVHETKELGDEEHGSGVHLQLVAFHSEALDNYSQKCAYQHVKYE